MITERAGLFAYLIIIIKINDQFPFFIQAVLTKTLQRLVVNEAYLEFVLREPMTPKLPPQGYMVTFKEPALQVLITATVAYNNITIRDLIKLTPKALTWLQKQRLLIILVQEQL